MKPCFAFCGAFSAVWLSVLHACAQPQPDVETLILGANGHTDYRIVLPSETPNALVETLLRQGAEVMQRAFAANDIEIPIVREDEHEPRQPGIYLGDTRRAREAGVDFDAFEAWDYVHRVEGRDLIIAGIDRTLPERQPDRFGRPQIGERVGTVKGVTDFLHRYAGTRFLYPRSGEIGIEFLPTPEIAVPAGLDAHVQSVLRYFFSERYGLTGARDVSPNGNDLYMIANNYLPNTDFVFSAHSYQRAIRKLETPEANLAYFALIGGTRTPGTHLCISNPDVQDLIYRDMLDMLDLGFDATHLGQQDGFRACQCEACRDLFDTGNDWGEKLWVLHRNLAERLLVDRPGKTVILLSYGHTWAPPKTFKEFPANTAVMLCRMTDELMAQWAECTVPRGYVGYLYLFGGYNTFGYLVQRTPLTVERLARRYHEMGLTGMYMDGFGDVFGLEGPTYYVFGRIFEAPGTMTAADLLEEFCAAAFREAAIPMQRFYETLYHAVQIYNDRPVNYQDIYGRTQPYVTRDPMRLVSFMYPPDVLAELDAQLTRAEGLAESGKARARLALVRLEFDRLRHIATIAHLWNGYRAAPGPGTHEALLAAVDAWNAFLAPMFQWSEERNGWVPGMRRGVIPEWPEHMPFSGESHHVVGFTSASMGRDWRNTPLNWDTAARRTAATPDAAQPDAAPDARLEGGPVEDWGAIAAEQPESRVRRELYRETFEVPAEWRTVEFLPAAAWGPWRFTEDPGNRGETLGYQRPDLDPVGWQAMPVPAWWSETAVGDYLGYGWYRVEIEVPESWRGRPLTLRFGGVDEQAWVYLNGKLVRAHTAEAEGVGPTDLWDVPFSATVPPDQVNFGGKNLLAVRVYASRGRAGIWRPVLISPAEADE